MTEYFRLTLGAAVVCGALVCGATAAQAQAPSVPTVRAGDYIVAVVNQELLTAREVDQRMSAVRDAAMRAGAQVPPPDEFRRKVMDTMLDERAQMSYARDLGVKIDDVEVERAVLNVASQNQMTLAQLRARLVEEGMDYARFRNNLRDQILVDRAREREMQIRIRITDSDIDALLEKRRQQSGGKPEYNVAQILVTVPDGATDAIVNQRRARAEALLERVKAGESFEAVAREVSEDSNKAAGGAMGLRALDRLPDVFAERVRDLQTGELSTTLLRTGAGFHVLKLQERRDVQAFSVVQTHARHLLLRGSPQLDQPAAMRRLMDYKRQIVSGASSFEQLAKDHSEDGSAQQGGDLGWTSPGTFVPEFEEAMNALPIGGVSDPLVSRFGVHLIRVDERRQSALDAKQEREQARNLLREERYPVALAEWNRELRARAYVELREPPP
jgi:peptidyl-prolyl cis-trans isomerase SurA